MGVARLYKIPSPYTGNQIMDTDYEQSADTMYLAHIDKRPTKLTRAGHTDWSFASIIAYPSPPPPASCTVTPTISNTDSENEGAAYFAQPASYIVTAVDEETGRESRPSDDDGTDNDLSLKGNYNTITWPAVTGASRYRIFKAQNGGEYGYIGGTKGLSFRDDNIGPDFSDGPPIAQSPFSGSNNRPSTVAFFEQRLMFGRTRARPNAVWGSRSGDYENFDISRPLKADDALSFALVSGKVNAVNQLVSTSQLLALTSDAIFKVDGGGAEGYLSPSSIVVRKQIGRGSSRLNPLIVDNVVFYRPSVGNAVRTIGYEFQQDGFVSNDVSIFSPHLFEGMEIVSWAYAQEPRSVVWAARSDGKLLCFTWEQEQQVWGWTVCETAGRVLSLAVISEEGEDRLYMTVRRKVGGVNRVYIERMAAARWPDVKDACYLDSAVSYSFSTAQTVLGNLHHLEGLSVDVLADGNVVSGLVVKNGRVTLPTPAKKASAGLPYTAVIETLPLAFTGQNGTNAGKRHTMGEVVLRVDKSRGLLVGPNEASLFAVKPRLNEEYGDPNHLMSGLVGLDMPPVTNGELSLIVQSAGPLPMTVTMIAIDTLINDR